MASISKAYILNHPEGNGLKRKEYITKSLERESIDFEVIDQFHPNEINSSESQKDFHLQKPIFVETTSHSYWSIPTKLSKNVISTYLKHKLAFTKQIENNYDYVIIFEDDCEIPNGLGDILRKCVDEMEDEGYEMAILSEHGNLISKEIRSGKYLHYAPNQKTRCLTGYIVNIKCAKSIYEFFDTIRNSPDIQMNEALQIYNVKVAWLEPGLKSVFESQQVHGWVEP